MVCLNIMTISAGVTDMQKKDVRLNVIPSERRLPYLTMVNTLMGAEYFSIFDEDLHLTDNEYSDGRLSIYLSMKDALHSTNDKIH